jgi:hypothetical protein
LNLNPLGVAIALDGIRNHRHGSEFFQSPNPLERISMNRHLRIQDTGIYLPNHSALEDYEHEQGEKTVIPVLI